MKGTIKQKHDRVKLNSIVRHWHNRIKVIHSAKYLKRWNDLVTNAQRDTICDRKGRRDERKKMESPVIIRRLLGSRDNIDALTIASVHFSRGQWIFACPTNCWKSWRCILPTIDMYTYRRSRLIFDVVPDGNGNYRDKRTLARYSLMS